MSFSTHRAAIKEAIEPTLRCYDYLPGSPATPCAVIGWPTSFDPHAAVGDVADYTIPVTLMVPFATNRAADEKLEALIVTTGDESIVAAIEAVSSAYRVQSVTEFGPITVGDSGQLALSCVVNVNVFA